jgi:hypothetical protein
MQFAAMPQSKVRGELSYGAAGPMGNAVVLHALTTGPLLQRVLSGAAGGKS